MTAGRVPSSDTREVLASLPTQHCCFSEQAGGSDVIPLRDFCTVSCNFHSSITNLAAFLVFLARSYGIYCSSICGTCVLHDYACDYLCQTGCVKETRERLQLHRHAGPGSLVLQGTGQLRRPPSRPQRPRHTPASPAPTGPALHKPRPRRSPAPHRPQPPRLMQFASPLARGLGPITSSPGGDVKPRSQ